MYTIRQLMLDRSDTEAWSVSPQSTVRQALETMADKNVGAILVMDQGQMIGIISERDFVRQVIKKDKCSLESEVSAIMTREMITVDAEHSLEDALRLMVKNHIRHLPVMDAGRLVGMVSMRDVMEAIISTKDSTIENLENYISGKEYPR